MKTMTNGLVAAYSSLPSAVSEVVMSHSDKGRREVTSATVDLVPAGLTPRQLEVLALLCEGLANKQIGRRLNIASATVKIHVARILRALGVSSRLQAVIAARRSGIYGDSAPERAPETSGPGAAALRILPGADCTPVRVAA